MRKLATIRKAGKLYDIPNKDFIQLLQVDGWQVIVKKGEMAEGDLIVFFEIDSFLPLIPEFEFLRKTTTYQGKEGYRLKTMKMSGAISQGLALPLSHFDKMKEWNDSFPYFIGDDVTELLGITKYDVASVQHANKPGLKAGNSKGTFPSFLPKTDQKRIQNLITYFDTQTGTEYEETLKLDGSSMTCYSIPHNPTIWERVKNIFGYKPKNYTFGVCSRNLEITESDKPDFWYAACKYNIEELLPCGYAIQGELVGPKIQSNHEKVKDLEFYIFDIYNIKEQRYLTPSERKHMMSGSLQSVPHVPIVNHSVKIFDEVKELPELLKRVEGQSINPGTISEGRVFKATDGSHTFKVISNKYLLKSEK